jgi:hypothetical protein
VEEIMEKRIDLDYNTYNVYSNKIHSFLQVASQNRIIFLTFAVFLRSAVSEEQGLTDGRTAPGGKF